MSRYSKEEWERRKTYLIRSLFEDLPILSPINESQEPSPSSPSDRNIYRPESPLPDLIIEREPPKNEESEDEEFYDKLAKEMRRCYKKDFLNEITESSADVSTEVTDRNTHDTFDEEEISLEVETREEKETFNDEKESLEAEIQEEIVEEEYAREEQEDSESSSTSTDSSDSEERYEEITTKVEVYAKSRSHEQLLDRTYSSEKDKSSRSKSTEIEVFSFSSEAKELGDDIENREVIIRPTGSKGLASPTETNMESSHAKSSDENRQMTPEIMRRRQRPLSDSSLPLHELPIYDSNDIIISKSAMDVDNTVMTENITDLAFDMDIANSNSLMHYTATSTPKSSKIKTRPRLKRHDNRLVPYSPSSRGSKDITCVALQTSFSSDHEPEWKELWSNFFIGTPTVYNLCSCKDHICT